MKASLYDIHTPTSEYIWTDMERDGREQQHTCTDGGFTHLSGQRWTWTDIKQHKHKHTYSASGRALSLSTAYIYFIGEINKYIENIPHKKRRRYLHVIVIKWEP